MSISVDKVSVLIKQWSRDSDFHIGNPGTGLNNEIFRLGNDKLV